MTFGLFSVTAFTPAVVLCALEVGNCDAQGSSRNWARLDLLAERFLRNAGAGTYGQWDRSPRRFVLKFAERIFHSTQDCGIVTRDDVFSLVIVSNDSPLLFH